MRLQDRLVKVKDALLVATPYTYHYTRPEGITPPFVVWQEDGGEYFHADNRNAEHSITGTIDVFSKTEFDTLFDDVPEALDGVATVSLNSVQYEDGTSLIHYEYRFTL